MTAGSHTAIVIALAAEQVGAQVCQDTQFKRKQELEQMQEYFARK